MKDKIFNTIILKGEKIIKWIYVSSSLFFLIPLLLLLIPQSLAPILWPNAILAPAYIWAEPAGMLWAYIIAGMIISIFGYRIAVWVNNTKKINRAVLSFLSIIIGVLIASLGWWIFRAYELSPILVQRDVAPVIILKEVQKTAQMVVEQLEINKPKNIKTARTLALIDIKYFIETYEELMEKQPNYPYKNNDFYYNDYLKAKEFIKKHKPTEPKDALNSDSAVAKPE